MSASIMLSYKAGDTLVSNYIVGPLNGTAQTVTYPTSTATAIFGVVDAYADSGSSVPVQINGIHKVYFNDTATAGGLVTCNNAGQGIPFVVATAPGWYVGVLIGTDVAATGTIADVHINPGFASSNV